MIRLQPLVYIPKTHTHTLDSKKSFEKMNSPQMNVEKIGKEKGK